MMRLIRFIFAIIMISGFSFTAVAQTDCPAFAGGVLEHVAALCGDVGQNQLCYGAPSVTVTPAADTSDFAFGQPGDRVGVGAVQALQLSPFNLNESAWGVVVMDVQANLPPDQSASYVLFGDVAVDNLGTAIQMEAHVATGNPINARSIPSTRGSVVAILNADASLTVNGRSAGGDWLRVQLDDGSTGWVAAYLLQSDADFAALEIADSDTPGYTPMQAITLKTGAGDTGCAEAPDSGLLVQTPENDAGTGIALQVNGVDMQLSGTALLRADADRGLVVNLLEGTGTLHALDKSMIVPAGAVVSVPLDTNLQVNGAPFSPIPYNPENLQGLPLSLLRRPIEVIEPLTVREINRMTACRIMSTVAGTNFREGPATAYFATGTLTQDTPYRVTGWTNGRDGFVWWRVSERHWVRTDIVSSSGNCDAVAYSDDRPAQPSISGVSSDLTCTSERVIFAKAGDTIPIADAYQSSAVTLGAIIARLYVDGDVVYEGAGEAYGIGIIWRSSWVATTGIHNVEVQYTPTVQISPDWAANPFEPGESWSHKVCQIRVE